MEKIDLVFTWAMQKGLIGAEPDWKAIRKAYSEANFAVRGKNETEEQALVRLCGSGQSLWAEIPAARIVIGPIRGKETIAEIAWKAKRMDVKVNWLTKKPEPGKDTWVEKQIHEIEIGFWMRH